MSDAQVQNGPAGEEAPRVVAGRYELVEELARGGMGVVWIARDRKLDRKIALKVLVATETDDAIGRFEREAKTVAALRSDHVVQVHDYGTEEGVPYIAMELLEGESLGDRLTREGSLGLDECAELLVQIARGLRSAHEAGLVHRDLKPSNIFLAERDEGTVVKLLDFGVVKAADRKHGKEATASGVVLGTPQYMSPEQARGIRQVDRRADLWSLGVILLRAITGQNPFSSESVGDAVIKICIEPIPRASELVQVPEELDAFFAKALARDPDERFQTAEELAQSFFQAVGRVDLASSVAAAPRRGPLVGPSTSMGKEFTASRRLGPGPRDPATGRSVAARTGGSRAAVRGLTPPSSTIGATLATSIARPAPKRRTMLFVALGGAAVVLGGVVAFGVNRIGGSGHAAGTAPSAVADGAQGTSGGELGSGDGGLPTAAADGTVAAAGAASAVASAAPSATAPTGSSRPTLTGPSGGTPKGVWVPSEGKQTTRKDAPKWY